MNILPINLISELDQPLFGANIFNLAKLENSGFPVPKGIAITPPEIILQTILKHYQDGQKEIFEQRLEIVRQEILKIPQPEGLKKELLKLKIKNNQIWVRLLEIWTEQFCSHLLRSGFAEGINSSLATQTIFNLGQKSSKASAYFDPRLNEVVIKSEKKLPPKVLKKIDELTILANKKLFIPQIYQFRAAKEEVFLMGLSPFTQSLPLSSDEDIVIPQSGQKKITKSAVKIFLNLSSGFTLSENADGVLIEGEKIGEIHDRTLWFEKAVFKLAEAALSHLHGLVIFKLPDVIDKEVRGTLRLLHQENLLKESTDVFLFVKNKKNLLNIELAAPLLRSAAELAALKKYLEVRGVYKIWVEVGVPENIINLEEYLEAGIDGVILNLDELQENLGGYKLHEGEFYKKQVLATIKFITPYLKALHKENIPVVAKGELCFYHEMLDFLIEAGIYGLVVNTALQADNLPEQLIFAERRLILKKFT